MDLPTYTSIWRIEKRLYKLYDFRLPMPLPIGQITVFAAVAVPYVLILQLLGLPLSHTLIWLYILPPGVVTWLATRPVLESKRLPELVRSQLRYLAEPKVICRMAPLAERDVVVVTGRVWRPRTRRAESTAAAGGLADDLVDRDVLERETRGAETRGAEAPGGGVLDGPDPFDRDEVAAGEQAFGQDGEPDDAPGWPEPDLAAAAQTGRRRRPLAPRRLRARGRAGTPERALADAPVPAPPAAGRPAAGRPAALPVVAGPPADPAAAPGQARAEAEAESARADAAWAAAPVLDEAATAAPQQASDRAPRQFRGLPARSWWVGQQPGRLVAGPSMRGTQAEAGGPGQRPGAPDPAGHAEPARAPERARAADLSRGTRAATPQNPAQRGDQRGDQRADSGRPGRPAWPISSWRSAPSASGGEPGARPAVRRDVPEAPGVSAAEPGVSAVVPGVSAVMPEVPAGLAVPARPEPPTTGGAQRAVVPGAAPGAALLRQPGVTAESVSPSPAAPAATAPASGPGDETRVSAPDSRIKPGFHAPVPSPPADERPAPTRPAGEPGVQGRPAAAPERPEDTAGSVPQWPAGEPGVQGRPAAAPDRPEEAAGPVPQRPAGEPGVQGRLAMPGRPGSATESVVPAHGVSEPAASESVVSEPVATEPGGSEPGVPEPGVPDAVPPDAGPPPRPQVTVVNPAAARGASPAVERALAGPSARRGDVRAGRVAVVPGGHRPGKPDLLQRDRSRAQRPIGGPARIVVLGCTVGAGQTMTALLTGDVLASLRSDRIAVLDLNPGSGSLARRAEARPALGQAALLTASRLAVIAPPRPGANGPFGGAQNGPRADAELAFAASTDRYELVLADPATVAVPRLLGLADQLILVAPASGAAPGAVAMTFEWLDAHGQAGLAAGAIMVLNGVSRRSIAHVEQAERVCAGRCRATVRVPWDDQLQQRPPQRMAGGGPQARQHWAGVVSPATAGAFTALAGVLVASLADRTGPAGQPSRGGADPGQEPAELGQGIR